MNDNNDLTTETIGENLNKIRNNQPGDNNNHSKIKLGWVMILIMLVFIIGSLVASFLLGQGDELKKIKLPYVALALIGVMFHLANQYRVRRDEESFNWKEYQFDYYFRAFQACIYVIVIDFFMENTDGAARTGANQSGISGNMTIISLLVGMYIRRVEEAFETLGDRFGDMIKGILGSSVQRLTPAERRQKLLEIDTRWIALSNRYTAVKPKLDEQKCKEIEELITKIKDLIMKGKVEPAELKTINLEFKINDLEKT